jgi:hypothetical protein
LFRWAFAKSLAALPLAPILSTNSPVEERVKTLPGDGGWAAKAGFVRSRAGDQADQSMKLKKIIWMEMVLIGASILIFRSVWNLLDSIAWASGGVGLAVLLIAGVVATVVALRSIEALSRKKGEKAEDE